MVLDLSTFKLGKLAPKMDMRTLMLRDYLPPGIEKDAPTSFDFSTKVSAWGMFGNNQYGDCTCAGAAHMVELFSVLAGSEVVPTDQEVIDMYFAITGGQDTGAVEIDVLNYWKQHGLAGVSPYAYTGISVQDEAALRTAIWLFGGVYIGVALPLSAQDEVGQIWTVETGPNAQAGSWGGHCVNVVQYDAEGLAVVTWGQIQRMTWGFWHSYCDEAYAILPSDWKDAAPEGFNFTELDTDLEALAA